jgi:GT2 family glycosyltransferase
MLRLMSSVNTPSLKIGVIVVAYDSGELLTRCIKSLFQAAEKTNVLQTIVVVDNHPDQKDISAKNLGVTYISLENNPGFGVANNHGIRYLKSNFKTDYFFLINPDAFVNDDFYTELLRFQSNENLIPISPISPKICFTKSYLSGATSTSVDFQGQSRSRIDDSLEIVALFRNDGSSRLGFDEKVKMIFPDETLVIDNQQLQTMNDFPRSSWFSPYGSIKVKNLFKDHLVQNAGSAVNAPFSAGDLQTYWLSSLLKAESPIIRQAWCGAAVLLPNEYVNKVGGFDENYFLYYEDTDYSMRGTSLGIFPYLNENLKVFHEHSASTNTEPERRNRAIWLSRSLFISQNFGFFIALAYSMALAARGTRLLLRRQTSVSHFFMVLLVEVLVSLRGAAKGLSKRKVPFFEK